MLMTDGSRRLSPGFQSLLVLGITARADVMILVQVAHGGGILHNLTGTHNAVMG